MYLQHDKKRFSMSASLPKHRYDDSVRKGKIFAWSHIVFPIQIVPGALAIRNELKLSSPKSL